MDDEDDEYDDDDDDDDDDGYDVHGNGVCRELLFSTMGGSSSATPTTSVSRWPTTINLDDDYDHQVFSLIIANDDQNIR